MQFIKAVIDKIEDGMALLKTKNGNIFLPAIYLPKKSQLGDCLYLTLSDQKEGEGTEKQEQKNLLNEILSSHD